MFVFYNPNPKGRRGVDCTVRAISNVTGDSWDDIYWDLCDEGFEVGDVPSADVVWASYLRKRGWKRHAIGDHCPDCYTVSDFASDHPDGDYIVSGKNHVVSVCSGDVYDTWNSSTEPIYFYWSKEE